MVFEYMESTLCDLLQQKAKLEEAQVKHVASHILAGLHHIHKHGYVHRDLKPENILVRGHEIKLGDFGLARNIHRSEQWTNYVSTRWYRSPELILRFPRYGQAVDIWAAAAVFAELAEGLPLFPGENEIDQLRREVSVCGYPSRTLWPEGHECMNKLGFRFMNKDRQPLGSLLPSCSRDLRNLIASMLAIDPSKRPSVAEAMSHEFFRLERTTPAPPKYPMRNSHDDRGERHENTRLFREGPEKSSFTYITGGILQGHEGLVGYRRSHRHPAKRGQQISATTSLYHRASDRSGTPLLRQSRAGGSPIARVRHNNPDSTTMDSFGLLGIRIGAGVSRGPREPPAGYFDLS
ncbi:hypothetical protein NDN08_002417 [Rhodosorus marinus]|uniref:Protein kinase domain-containing protein n=1 Tax=Rhodosorus marinus TaxID=101924 RepID=A0AAV8UTN1_9RHOD|nr:hypothetical protein NDN08_002417 [Rhodosorus marinus]